MRSSDLVHLIVTTNVIDEFWRLVFGSVTVTLIV